MAGSINGIIIELRGNPSELRKELEKIETIAGNLNKKLENEGTHWNKIGSSVENLGSTFEKIGNKVSSLGDKLTKNVTNPFLNDVGKIMQKVGDLGNAFGTITSGVGTVTKAVGLMKNGIGEATGAAANLAKAMQVVATPTGLVTMGITAAVGALAYFSSKETESQKEARAFAEEMSNAKTALDEYCENINKTREANLSHVDSVQRLSNELKELVDENGNVKEGEEGRAKFIVETLNNALGTEYELNGNIIKNYKDMQSEIDKLIEKKKAEIILNSQEEKYKDALENQKQALEDLRIAKEKFGGQSIQEAESEVQRLEASGKLGKKAAEEMRNMINAYNDAESRVKTYTENVKQYEENYEQFLAGNYEAINTTVTGTTKNWCEQNIGEIANSITEQGKLLNDYKGIYETTGNELANETQKQAQANLEILANELVARSQELEQLGPLETQAWAKLATSNRDTFMEKIKELNPEMQEQLMNIASVIDNDQEIVYNISKLSDMAKQAFTSHESSTWGYDMIKGITNGIVLAKRKELQPTVNDVARGIRSILHFSKPDKGPLRDYETWMPDMVKGLSNTLRQSAPILENEINILAEKVKMNLNIPSIIDFREYGISSSIIDRTKVTFTTPTVNIYAQDELTPSKMNSIIDTVNRRLGSKY